MLTGIQIFYIVVGKATTLLLMGFATAQAITCIADALDVYQKERKVEKNKN